MFNRQQVIDETGKFSPNHPQPLTYQQKAYASFYGIHFSEWLTDVEHQMGNFTVEGYRIFAQSWQKKDDLPRGTLIIIHGYLDHLGLYKHVIEYGLKRNFRVVGFDLPGHGLSSGDSVAINDFLTYQKILNEWLKLQAEQSPTPWYLIGQSTGAAIIMDYLLINQINESKNPFHKIAFLAPLVRPAQWLAIRALYYCLTPFTQYARRKFSKNSHDKEFLDFLKNSDPMQSKVVSGVWIRALMTYIKRIETAAPIPVTPLIFQGDQDMTVDCHYNLMVIEKKFWQPKIVYLDGAKHHLVNEAENYRRIIFNETDRWFGIDPEKY